MQLDHIVLATCNLQQGIQTFQKHTKGITPIIGGTHANLGTQNALVKFDTPPGTYLELLGPTDDADNPPPKHSLGESIAMMHQQVNNDHNGDNDGDDNVPFHYAIRTNDLPSIQQYAKSLGFEPLNIMDMSRTTTDEKVLKWKFLFLRGHDLGGLVPFFIDWLDTPHPTLSPTQPSAGILHPVQVQCPTNHPLKKLLKNVKGVECCETSSNGDDDARGSNRLTFTFQPNNNTMESPLVYSSTSPGGIEF